MINLPPMGQGFKALLVLALLPLLLTACDTIGEEFEPPAMQKPLGTQTTIPQQDTPALEARAVKERETLPQPPVPPDPQTYSYLGTVPPKPTLPSEADIAGQVKSLAAEEAAGSAVIARQADAAEPETLPKPGAAVEATEGTPLTPMSASDDQVFSGNTNPFLPQSQSEQTDRLPRDAP